MIARFICGYQGESDYEVDGRRYSVRLRANDYHTFKADHFAASVVPSVGTVRNGSGVTEFPPREVVALFPGFVGARWDQATNAIVYDGPAPVTTRDQFGVLASAPNPNLSLRDGRYLHGRTVA